MGDKVKTAYLKCSHPDCDYKAQYEYAWKKREPAGLAAAIKTQARDVLKNHEINVHGFVYGVSRTEMKSGPKNWTDKRE